MYMETIVKGAGSQQRIVHLPNGMRVRCISNPEAKESTVSVCVDIGSTADPSEWPGMAHLVGRLVVAGDKRDGATGAAVEVLPFMTTFWLTVSHAGFGKALRTIGRGLVEPSFEALNSRTIDSIQKEFERACGNDNQRLQRLIYTLGDMDHPLTQANAGNRGTLQGLLQGTGMLSGDGKEVVRRFFEQYYSADIMHAEVVGCCTLDQIAEEVAEAFDSVKSRGDTRIRVSSSPYPAARMGRVVQLQTLGNQCVMELVFPVTEICSISGGARNVKGCVAAVVETGIAGALAASLRELGLANKISAWSEWLGSAAEFGGFFHIKVACTDQGYQKYAEAAEMVLAYLAAIREAVAGVRAAADPVEPAESVAVVVQRLAGLCAANRALAAALQTHTDFDVDELARFLDQLHPANCRVMLGAPTSNENLVEKEPYYGIRYAENRLPDSILRAADSNNRAWRGLFAPSMSDRSPRAWLVELTEHCEIWAADTKQDAASATVHILLENSVSAQSPQAAECTHLLAALVHEMTSQEMAKVWYAEISNFSVTAAATGIAIRANQPGNAIDGTTEMPTLGMLLTWVLQNTRAGPERHSADRFARQKAMRREQLGSAHAHRLRCPSDAAAWHAKRLTRQNAWLHETSLRELDALDHAGFVRTAGQMLAAATRIVVLVAAASPLVRAQTVNSVRDLLDASGAAKPKPLWAPALHRPAAPAYDLDPGTYQLHVDHASESTGSAASEYNAVSYTMLAGGGTGGIGSRRGCALTLVLTHVMRGAFIGGMQASGHTIDQGGATCEWIGAGRAHGASAVRLCVQSRHTPWLLRLRIEAFLRAFRRDVLGAMSDAAFAAAVGECLVPTEASTRERFWAHIVDGDYDFDRSAAICTHLRALSIRDVEAFWDAYIEPRPVLSSSAAADGVVKEASRRRAIIVHVWGAAQNVSRRQPPAAVQRYSTAVLAVHSCLLALQSAGKLAGAVDLEKLNVFVESCAQRNVQTPSGGRDIPLRTTPAGELCALTGCAGSGSGSGSGFKSGNVDAVAQVQYTLDMAIEAASAAPPSTSHIFPTSTSRRLDNVGSCCAWRTAADEWVVEDVQWFRTMHPIHGQPVPFSRLAPSI
ncbi:metalloprotease [Coemansia sp. RSA 1939]|nr:metalloprotease [Coemansia sp. RSA 1939]KAJ2688048.1 metalloprotease [Coemansia sp. RSA 1285]